MKQYIDKSALVAKIDDWRHNIMMGVATLHGHQRADATFEYEILGIVRDFLDTLEVKEVDLDYIKKELDELIRRPDRDFGWGTLYDVATHFFKLGLKARGE